MFSFEILEVQFDFPHIFIKISRRHNCFSGRYGLCTIVNTYQNDRHLSLKGDVIKPFFPVRVRLAGSFGCDSQMKLFAFSKMMNHLVGKLRWSTRWFINLRDAKCCPNWSTHEVLRKRSKGIPPTALKIIPNGKKNHSFFIMKLVLRPSAP